MRRRGLAQVVDRGRVGGAGKHPVADPVEAGRHPVRRPGLAAAVEQERHRRSLQLCPPRLQLVEAVWPLVSFALLVDIVSKHVLGRCLPEKFLAAEVVSDKAVIDVCTFGNPAGARTHSIFCYVALLIERHPFFYDMMENVNWLATADSSLGD